MTTKEMLFKVWYMLALWSLIVAGIAVIALMVYCMFALMGWRLAIAIYLVACAVTVTIPRGPRKRGKVAC
jgi:hypothetical protein